MYLSYGRDGSFEAIGVLGFQERCLLTVGSTRGRGMRSQLKCKRDQKDKEETELGTETTGGQRGGGFVGRV